jgi:hypothetical protein
MAEASNIRSFHVNSFQQQVLAADCKEMYCATARAGGKTFTLAKYSERNMHSMPRCMRLFLSPSYRKMVTDLLPGIVATWEKIGYRRDVHFVIGNSNVPKKMKWDSPIYCPEYGHREHIVHWYTGAAYRIGSADRKVTLNGTNLDGIDADEVKLIHEDTFKEIIKTNRANPDRPWSHLPEHNSIVAFTDKYWTRKNADWIMKKKPLADMEAVQNIFKLQLELDKITLIDEYGITVYTNDALATRLKNLLIKMRNNTIAFFEAATYVNIPAITPQYIMQMKRNMGENEFRASILNHDIIRNDAKEYFYPLFDEGAHTYIADDYSKLDNLEYNFAALKQTDCTFDTDRDVTLPLEISCDWGGSINCLSVCQQKHNAVNFINAMFTKNPDTIKELAKKFNDYYRPHPIKHLRFYYDPSGNNKMPNSSETIAEEFARYLREAGWMVEMMHVGFHNNPRYELRYQLFSAIYQKRDRHDPKFPYVFFNRHNCKELIISILDAPLKKMNKKLLKDKSSEKPNSGIAPEHATHFSDTVDYIIMHKFSHLLDANQIPATMGEALM